MDHGECWNLAFPPVLLGCWRFLLLKAWGKLLILVSDFSSGWKQKESPEAHR